MDGRLIETEITRVACRLQSSLRAFRSRSARSIGELKKLWAESGSAMTRASLMNLAVYSEAPGSLPLNTKMIFKITRRSRLSSHRDQRESRGERKSCRGMDQRPLPCQSCGKQTDLLRTTFVSRWKAVARNCCPTLFSLISIRIFPFIFGGRANFTIPMDPQLWAWVDRVIYDSQTWNDFDSQMSAIETAQAEAKQRIVLCDLNWTRLVQIRLAMAQFFDHPAAHHRFDEIETVQIDFAPGFKSTALLLAGWLAAQLKWRLEKTKDDDALRFIDSSDRIITFELNEKPGEPIGRMVIRSGKVAFSVSHATGSDLLEVVQQKPDATGACS